MRHALLSSLTLAAVLSASAADYKITADWLKLPPTAQKLGDMHGDIAVSSAGEVYVSVQEKGAGIKVFGTDGRFVRALTNAPSDFHGFVIKKQADGEFIYGPRLGGQEILKLNLDGTPVMKISASVIPNQFKNHRKPKGQDNKDEKGTPYVSLTGMDVTPSGDLFVTDGYASDYVHRFDSKGNYQKSFGGRAAPYGFKTLHKIAVDTRFSPARLIGCDRANLRVVHLSLDGEFLGVVAKDMLLPAAVAVQGDYALIGEIKGQVTVLDKEGRVVARLGTNTAADEVGTNKTEPAKWRPGVVTAPHGVAFDGRGNIYVAEYSTAGRVHRFELAR